MATTTVAERLAEMQSQIEELEAKGAAGTAEAKVRIQRQLAALREQESSARAAAKERVDAFEEKFEEFEARLQVARSSVAEVGHLLRAAPGAGGLARCRRT